MDNFTVGNVTQNLNEYLLDLKVDYMTLSIAAEQGGGKTSESVLVMVFPKAKVASRKWIHAEHGREVIVKDKIVAQQPLHRMNLLGKRMHRRS